MCPQFVRFLPFALLAVIPLQAAVEQRALQLPYDDLAPHIKGKYVTLELKDGIVVSGKVRALESEGLRVFIDRTPDSNRIKPGRQLIPRANLAKIRLDIRGKTYRAILMSAIPAALTAALAGAVNASSISGGDGGAVVGAGLGGVGGGLIAGYLIGNHLDLQQRLTITVMPDDKPAP